MFFLKPQPDAIRSLLRGDAEKVIQEKNAKSTWMTAGGLTPSQVVQHLNLDSPLDYKIPVYTRAEKKLKFLSKESFEDIFEVEFAPTLHFDSFRVLDDIASRTRKYGSQQKAHTMNKWTHALLSRQCRAFTEPLGAIKWINHELGYGVFAYKDIPEYTYIGEYTGHVRKRTPRKDQFNNYVFRYVSATKDSPYVIDARDKGTFTRFINHSDAPNLTSRWIILDGITRIIFFTNSFIKRGAQLTYDYGEQYWNSRRFPKLL